MKMAKSLMPQNRISVVLAGFCLWMGNSAPAWAVTNGNVTWSGAGGTPGWEIDANWLGGVAPTNPTKATVFYTTNGQAVVGVLDADREVGRIDAGITITATNSTHTLNLGAHTLTITNLLRVVDGSQSQRNTLNLTNGTVRIGTAAVAGSINVLASDTLRFAPGTILDSYNLHTLYVYPNQWAVSEIDLRGAVIAGETLRMRRLQFNGWGWYGSRMLLDNATDIHAIEVTETFELAKGGINQNTPQYLGNPSDSFTMDGFTFGKLPAGINLTVGTSAVTRATMVVVEHTDVNGKCIGAIRAAVGGGGSFTGYLSTLRIGYRSGTGVRQPRGLLDLAAMDSCMLDAVDLQIAPGQASPPGTDNEQGELRLPPGTATIGTAVIGATAGIGYGILALSNTTFTVTNSFTLNATASNSISLGAEPKGLDVQGTFIDGGGKIRVNFLAAPASGTTNWAVRIKGDAQATLNPMMGTLRLSSAGAFTGKKVGVLYDAATNYTYFAMADSNAFSTLPIALAYPSRTYEFTPGYPVLIGTNNINNGSFDPDGRPITLTLNTNGGPEVATLTFTATGDYATTLKVTAGADSATATCSVHVVALNPGVTNDLIWNGAASTPLSDHREWMWSENWVGGLPPSNPTPATIYYRSDGQSVTDRLEQSRMVGGIAAGDSVVACTHTMDLNGKTLTITNQLSVVSQTANSTSLRNTLYLTNGTVQIGTATAAGSISANINGTLCFRAGSILDTYNLHTLLGNTWAYGSTDIDLRGAVIAGGTLRARRLQLLGAGQYGSRLLLDNATDIHAIEVTETCELGKSAASASTPMYIGNPSDTFVRDTKTFGKFPAGISLTMGTSRVTRASMVVAEDTGGQGAVRAILRVAEGGGGSFTGYLSNLRVGFRSGADGTRIPHGLLDLAAMDSCMIDAEELQVAPGRTNALPSDNEQGELRLPRGTATIGTAIIGATNGMGFGILVLSNTLFTVTNSITLNATAQMTVNVSTQSCGLFVSNAANTALDMTTATNNALRIRFLAAPAAPGLHVGFRWLGNHVTAVKSLISAGTIAVDDAALGSKRASVFKTGGTTYLGIPPVPGSVFAIH